MNDGMCACILFWRRRRRRKEAGHLTHTCNPTYSGDRDQGDRGLKPALGKQFERPYLKKTITKRGGIVAHGADPKSPPPNHKKKKKKKGKKK
jgi:hypothetical protein